MLSEQSRTEQNKTGSPNPRGRGARLPPMSEETRRERRRAQQRAANARSRDRAAARANGLPDIPLDDDGADVLKRVDLAPHEMARLMRFHTREAVRFAVETMRSEDADMRHRVFLCFDAGAAPDGATRRSDPALLVADRRTTATPPAAASMPPAQLDALHGPAARRQAPLQLPHVAEDATYTAL